MKTGPFGWVIFGIAVVVVVAHLFAGLTGTKDAFWTSSVWETILLWVIGAALLSTVVAFASQKSKNTEASSYSEPPWSRFLFNDSRSAPLWLAVRLYLGWAWLDAGLHKVADPKWVDNGQAILGFWKKIAAVPAAPASPVIKYDWYRDFIQFLIDSDANVWFGKLIAYSEFLVGLALVLGVLTGFAALAGSFMNMNFMLAGSASTNPVMLVLAILVLMAWRVSGHIGFDNWLLPRLGTPWQPPVAGRVITVRSSR